MLNSEKDALFYYGGVWGEDKGYDADCKAKKQCLKFKCVIILHV